MNLCVFQGTFNPIHKMHIAMAEYVLKEFRLDKILFIPAYNPPQKSIDRQLAIHRLNMVKLALDGRYEFDVSDIEFERDRFSYTYLTILELYKRYNISGKVKFIIGSDAFLNIESWYEIDKLKDLIEFIVLARGDDNSNFEQLQASGFEFQLPRIKFRDLSSTQIRQNPQCRGDEYLCPQVRKYIEENGLY